MDLKRKTSFTIHEHQITPGSTVVEIHADGVLIGTINEGFDFAGVRIVSKYSIEVESDPGPIWPNAVKVRIDRENMRARQSRTAENN
jgi:hypothetical protein